MTLSFASNQVSVSKAKALGDAVESMSTQQTSRTYVFKKLQGTHRDTLGSGGAALTG